MANLTREEARLKNFSDEIPDVLMSYKEFHHPVRLSIIKLLHDNGNMTSIKLREMIGVDWGKFNNHLKSLKNSRFIRIDQTFVDERISQLIILEQQAITKYQQYKESMIQFLENTHNLDVYIKHAEQLKKSMNGHMYPNSE